MDRTNAGSTTPRRTSRRNAAPEQRALQVASGAFLLVVLTGFVGYQVIEGVGPLDALYMTVITITTVGFGEVVTLSDAGRVLTIGLIVAGVGSASYAAITAAEFIVEGHLADILERRRREREMERMHDHVVVCGFGRVGRHLAEQLEHNGKPFVVVDNDDAQLSVVEELGYPYVAGDSTEEHVLVEAGIHQAHAVVACVNTDADNVLVTLTAKGLAPDTVVIARSKADENERKLRRAGADRVIAPSTIGGRRIAALLTRPALSAFLDALSDDGVDYTFEEVPVTEGSALDGSTLRESGIRERWGCTVLAVRRRGEGAVDTHPSADEPLRAGDLLVIMGSQDDTARMRAAYT